MSSKDIKDSLGFPIQDGQTLERVIDGRGAIKGHQYRAEAYKWDDDDTEVSIVANGDFIREKLDEERAKEFRIVV